MATSTIDDSTIAQLKQQREQKLIQLMLFKHRMYAMAQEVVKTHWFALRTPNEPVRVPAIKQDNNLAAMAYWMKS